MRAKELLESGQRFVRNDDYARAIAEFEKSRDLFTKLGDMAEAGLAEVCAVQFLPDVAQVALSRQRLTAIIANANSRKFRILIPPAYYWLGVSQYRQGNLSEMTRSYKMALRLAEDAGNTFELQHTQEALAAYYSGLGELEPALFYASKMLPAKDLYYQNERQSWREKGTLATLTLKLKFFATSLSFSKEGWGIAREISPTSLLVNQNLRNMVEAAAARKDFDDALRFADESRQIANGRKESAKNTEATAEIYMQLGDVKSSMKNCKEALADYDRALELYARLPELTVGSYRIHKGKLFCFQQLDQSDNFKAELKTVLNLSEEYRARLREDDARQAFFANEQVVFDAAAANAIKERDNLSAYAFVEASRARSLLDFVESDKPLAQVVKEFASTARSLSLAEIQSRLPEEVQLVQYAVLPDRLLIWVVSKSRFDLIERDVTAAALEKKIDDYRAAVVGKETAANLKPLAEELYRLLIPPNLDARKQLCVVADKSLHQLAFSSLVSPSGKYLLEDFALLYAPSASVLVLATENARRKATVESESLLSIGNPDFDREENPNLADLQAAEAEAKTIAASYRKTLMLTGAEATKESFLLNFTGAEVIHFAGHFVANPQSPANSKLLFAGGDLRSFELGAYKLPRAKLVVLSACETGFERYNKSEGAIGIARTFLALGSPVVVASAWKVDSEPTKDLMIAFHRNRKERGLSSAESLRRAQLELMSKEKTKEPFYWAAFSLFGGYSNY